MKHTVIGQLQHLGEAMTIIELYPKTGEPNPEPSWHLCRNVEAFLNSTTFQIQSQRIKKVIAETVFMERSTFQFYKFQHKATVDLLYEKFKPDQHGDLITSMIKLCQGADYADMDLFCSIKDIVEWKELTEAGSSIPAGFGYPGHGISYFIVEPEHDIRGENIYIQEVPSYMEGYTVLNHRLPNAVFKACQTDTIKALFTNN
jgi:hypothetical protein